MFTYFLIYAFNPLKNSRETFFTINDWIRSQELSNNSAGSSKTVPSSTVIALSSFIDWPCSVELTDDVGDGKGDAPVLRAARTVTSCQSSRKNYIQFQN